MTTRTTLTIEHRISGRETSGNSDRTAPVYDPATGEHCWDVVLGNEQDAADAVSAAQTAFESWADVSQTGRARIMFRFRELLDAHAEELARVISSQHGKVLADARGEVARGLEVVEFACGIGELLKGDYSDQVASAVDAYSFREPLGVCVGITPFNFPVMVPMWMHPIAIAAGNAFVLKPSERDPSVSNLVADLYASAGLPAGVFNVLHGDKAVVDALIDAPAVRAVSFVGSTPVAKYVFSRATDRAKRVQALGGAKNHAVVMPDADIEFAARHLSAAAYGSAGQRCMAISVAVAVGDIGDELVAKLAQQAREVRVGAGLDPSSEMGPLITAEARARVEAYVATGVDSGATAVVDGRRLEMEGDGFWIGPTLFDHVTTDLAIYTDEIFGPVLCVVRVPTPEEAVDLINRNPYANGCAVFTSSGGTARWFQRAADVGMVGINVPIPVPMAFHSFGGRRDSLFGDHHAHGPEGVRFYTRNKAITSRWPAPGASDDDHGARLSFPTST